MKSRVFEAVVALAFMGAGCDGSSSGDVAHLDTGVSPTPDGGADGGGDATPSADAEADSSAPCLPGTEGCPCVEGRCGFTPEGAELLCDAEVCRPAPCPAGTEGCPCDAGACDDGGVPLECRDDLCARPGCAAGATGCPCDGGECASPDDTCTDETCRPSVCEPGLTGCPCDAAACTTPGDGCIDGACRPDPCPLGTAGCACRAGMCDVAGFVCQAGTCQAERDACPAGTLGCACGEDAACGTGLACRGALCMPCQPGSLRCDCVEGTCAPGLACDGARCVRPGDLAPPDARPCYTPCADSLVTADGQFLECPADGLMAGCHLGGRACREGSCLLPDEPVPACADDTECLEFQTCLQGGCYSTCTGDADCPAGTDCHLKVCRRICDIDAALCDPGYACVAIDGTNGLCMPSAGADEGASRPEAGHVDVSRAALELTNVADTGGFAIRNESEIARTITVRKLDHTLTDARGRTDRRRHDDPAAECDLQQDCPLAWLDLGPQGATERQQAFEVRIPAGEQISVEVGNAGGSPGVRWQGTLEITAPGLSTARVQLAYTQTPEGQWSGTMYSFGRFPTEGLAAWTARPHGGRMPEFAAGSRDDPATLDEVRNAFIKKWSAFRRIRMSYEEFQAVLISMRTESWSFPATREACARLLGGDSACYLWSGGPNGLASFTDNLGSNPVPAGVIELPMSMSLRVDPDDPRTLSGRIDSTVAMHYAGDPAVELRFADEPTECSRVSGSACLTFFEAAAARTPFADIQVGGRFERAQDDPVCPREFERVRQPWLPRGFERDTQPDAAFGRVREECRSTALPFAGAADAPRNVRLAASNPIPDGRARRRRLYVVDGALINQNALFIIFEERFDSFLGETDDAGFSGYGYMLLSRQAKPRPTTDADGNGVPDAFEGASPPAPPADPGAGRLATVACEQSTLDALNIRRLSDDPDAAVEKLVHGATQSARNDACTLIEPTPARPQPCLSPGEFVHVFCEDTGLVDHGGRRVPCPAESRVEYFTLDANRDAEIQGCNAEGNCALTLERWRQSGALRQDAPAWRCRDADERLCDDDRADLLADKVFFANGNLEVSAPPLAAEIEQAFRYKTRFRNREGTGIGFAPAPCRPGSDRVPYCYDAPQIERIRGRVDCLLHVWGDEDLHDDLSAENRSLLNRTLVETFSLGPVPRAANFDPALLTDGFERLYAELLVMLADEAVTRAFASRYELEGRQGAFPGAAFESEGVDLSGTVGAEFRNLHEAVQLYDEALQRFYSLAPTIWQSIEAGGPRNFVTAEMVTAYIERVLRASTQKARAQSAIAERYEAIDRPDLARRVIERAFTGTWLESVVLARMMLGIVDFPVAAREAREGLRQFAVNAQRRYQAAMVDMRSRYQAIQENVNFFGFAPDYIPFPTIDERETNGFERVLARALAKVRIARDREDTALLGDRAFETDSAQFQSELVRLRNTYESQLGELCGTFAAGDAVYPAIKRYAHLSPALRGLGDPCSYVGNGAVFNALGAAEVNRIDLQRVLQQMDSARREIEIELGLIADECELVGERADYVRAVGESRVSLQDFIRDSQFDIERLQAAVALVGGAGGFISALASCNVDLVCAGANSVLALGYDALHTYVEIEVSSIERDIHETQRAIELAEVQTGEWTIRQECRSLTLTRTANIDRIQLRLMELKLEGLRAEYQLRLGLSEMRRLFQRAQRLQQEQAEAEQLAIDVEAARNDPNVRLYRNDAVINAEVSFEAALREAYRATLVFEYYTSQSYARRGDLFLIRLVARGERNLENYLAELDDAFFEFEQSFGLPDTRVLVLSLMDDILTIPRIEAGTQRTLQYQERVALLRAKLREPGLLDERGYLSIPFDTRIDDVSPVTRNHKIRRIEAEMNFSNAGDSVARLYLTQAGTSVLHALGGERLFYRLPPVTAVLNPYFSGAKGVFSPEVYSNARMRDRPLVSTGWRLVFNQRDEAVNQDVDLASINDIRLFVYYTDFTEF